jgi:hypothetical protein
MHIKDLLQIFAAIMIVTICASIIFFSGYSHGVTSFQKEAIDRNFGRIDIQTRKIVFLWNDII